jgi:zeaxanthin glucosyltransferase
MAKILCVTTGLTGIRNASFELINRLQAEGNQCICASPADVGTEVKAQGFDYLQLPEVNYDPAPSLPYFGGPFKKLKRIAYKYRYVKTRRAEAIKSLGMSRFMKLVQAENPDLILVDVELHEHIMTLVVSEFKVILLSQWFSLWKQKGLPPLVSDIMPGVGFDGSLFGIKWAWTKIEIKRWWVFFKRKWVSGFTDRRSVLLEYAKQIGFSKKYIPDNYWPGPFTYAQLPVISITSDELEFPHDKRPNLHYIGPMVYEKRLDTQIPSNTRKKLEKVIEEKKASNKRLIYCSVSTFKSGDASFIKKVISAVSQKKDWILIVGLGGKLQGQFQGTLPANVYIFDYVPQLQVLKDADLSINHGGIHTINECIHFGVPMLIYSGKRSDQNGCAARIHHHGLGIMADKDGDDLQAIRMKIDTILKDGTFHFTIKNIRRKLEEEKPERMRVFKIITDIK